MKPMLAWTVLLAAVCAGDRAEAQPTQPTVDALPRFEVASVKPSPQRQDQDVPPRIYGGPGTKDPGQITCAGCRLLGIITTAYEVGHSQMRFPDWVFFQKYDIIAKVPSGSTRHGLNLMLQQLLAERFRLIVHWEKKNTPVYALVVGKQGHRLQRSEDSATESELLVDEPVSNPALSGNNLFTITGQHSSMKQLADALSRYVDRQVIDMTELKDHYDFSLAWIANEHLPLPKRKDLPPGIKVAPHYPADAVQIQLGLKLEPRKMLLDILVVDSALKVPIEN